MTNKVEIKAHARLKYFNRCYEVQHTKRGDTVKWFNVSETCIWKKMALRGKKLAVTGPSVNPYI